MNRCLGRLGVMDSITDEFLLESDWLTFMEEMRSDRMCGQMSLFPLREIPYGPLENRRMRTGMSLPINDWSAMERRLPIDPEAVLCFVNGVRAARGREPLNGLALTGAVRGDGERCLLARAMDCTVLFNNAVQLETTTVADAVRERTGERGEAELVSLPESAMAIALRFDAGGLSAKDLVRRPPGQLRFSRAAGRIRRASSGEDTVESASQ